MLTQSKVKSIGVYCIVLFVIFIVIQQIETELVKQNAASGGPLANAGMYPYGVAILMALLLLLDILDTWFFRKKNDSNEKVEGRRASVNGNVVTVLSVIGLTAAYQYFLSSVGYLLLTPCYLFFLFKFLHAGKNIWCLCGSIIITVMLYVIFQFFLNVVLPVGLYQFI